MPYPGWKPKRIKQYKKILATGAPKSEAAAIVNSQRKKKGELKKVRK
jgi:hypothetical protein